MKQPVTWVATAAMIAIWTSVAGAADATINDVVQIKQLEENFVAGVNARDVDRIMSNYINSPDLVVFDLVPPRQYTGWNAYRDDWKEVLGRCRDAPIMLMTDLRIDAGRYHGYGHNVQHFSCTTTSGTKMDLTFRVTDGYKKIGRRWFIAHEHISVPVNLETGKADLASKP